MSSYPPSSTARDNSANRFTQVVTEYLTKWDCFSGDFVAQIEALGKLSPWPIFLIMLMSTMPTLTFMLTPFSDPGDGWRAVALLLVLVGNFHATPAFMAFPIAVLTYVGAPLTAHAYLKATVHGVVASRQRISRRRSCPGGPTTDPWSFRRATVPDAPEM